MYKFILLALLVSAAVTQEDTIVVSNESESEEEQVAGTFDIQNSVYILTENDFRSAVESFDFTLVKFFAPWCGHCKGLAPIYKEVAQTLESTESPGNCLV